MLYVFIIQHYKTSCLQVLHLQLRKMEKTHLYWQQNPEETGSCIVLNNYNLLLEADHFNTNPQFTLIAELSKSSKVLHLPMLKNMFSEQLFFNCSTYRNCLIAEIKSDHWLKRQNHFIISLLYYLCIVKILKLDHISDRGTCFKGCNLKPE